MKQTQITSVVFLAILALATSGCRPPGDNHGHDHSEEPKTAQITVWTDGYEVFAEHQAPIAGEATTFITHVTDLRTLEPRREGMVKFLLRQGQTVAEHPQAAPARPGIYLPGIIFPKPGDWQVTLLIPGNGKTAEVDLGTIQVYADEDAAAHAQIADGPEGLSFLKEQQWRILAKAEPVTRQRLVERVVLPATTMAKPGYQASIVAPVAGQLLAPPDGELPLPGQLVEAGQLLALLRPSFSEAAAKFADSEGEYARAKAAFEKAQVSYERTKALAEQEAKSKRELQEAELALETARASYEAAATLRATYRQPSGATRGGSAGPLDSFGALELRAPIAGVVNRVDAGLGEPVPADGVVFQILNPEVVWIEAHVPEAALSRIPGDAGAGLATVPGHKLVSINAAGGRRVFTGLQVDPVTRTVPLVYEARNGDLGLRIGQSVSLHVETSRAEDAIAIPDSAVVEEDGNLIAFVQVSGETFQKRDLELGIRDGGLVQVLNGLSEGERVVTKGAMAIRLASVSGVIPAHGHAH